MPDIHFPKFKVGDVVQAEMSYIGQKPDAQQFQIIAVYKNLLGFWYVSETIGGEHPGDQVPVGEHFYAIVAHATNPVPVSPAQSASKGFWRRIIDRIWSVISDG